MSSFARKIKKNSTSTNQKDITFICLKCKCKENIPFHIVDMLDRSDYGNQDYPPRFNCENCDGLMTPVYYKNYKGKIYQNKD